MLIVITGLDGSGTSSIAKKLHETNPDSYLFRTPSVEFTDRGNIDTVVRKESSTAHMLYYLSSVVYISDYIKKHCDYKNKNVYVLRYLIDTVVSNRAAGIPIKLDYTVYGNDLLQPDLTIFVELEEEERERRILSRGKDVLDEVLDNEKKREGFLQEYENLLDKEKTIYIKNDKDLNEVISELNESIKKFAPKIKE